MVEAADPMRAIRTQRLVLEPLRVAHAAAMFDVLDDAALHEWVDTPPPASVEALASRYARLEARRSPDASEHWLNWIVVVRAGLPCGFVQASVPREGGDAWVGYVIGRRAQRQGFGREAVAAMLPVLARDWRVGRALAGVEAANAPSIRLLKALGFGRADAAEHAAHAMAPTEQLWTRALAA